MATIVSEASLGRFTSSTNFNPDFGSIKIVLELEATACVGAPEARSVSTDTLEETTGGLADGTFITDPPPPPKPPQVRSESTTITAITDPTIASTRRVIGPSYGYPVTMPRFTPFRAHRYAQDTDLNAVIAPPYDVLSDADVTVLARRSPHNIVHIDVPAGGEDRYDLARERLNAWLAEGVMATDDEPSLTIYRMAFTDAAEKPREIVGVLGGLEVVDEGAGGVLPHEHTTPKAKTDRLDLTRATSTNLSPVWGLSLASGLTAALAEPGESLGTLEVDGATHTVERITDPDRIAQIAQIIASDDVLIADGHHRYAISRIYRDEVRAATRRLDTPAEETLTFVNELSPDQLSIDAIHRVYTGVTFDALKSVLAESFELSKAPAPTSQLLAEMVEFGRLALLAPDGSATWLTPKPGAFDGVRALDGAWLEHALADLDADVTYQHGLNEMLQLVRSGEVTAGVLIRPTTLAEIERTAREGLLMPPKSTFFTPKLRTGFVLRPTQPLR